MINNADVNTDYCPTDDEFDFFGEENEGNTIGVESSLAGLDDTTDIRNLVDMHYNRPDLQMGSSSLIKNLEAFVILYAAIPVWQRGVLSTAEQELIMEQNLKDCLETLPNMKNYQNSIFNPIARRSGKEGWPDGFEEHVLAKIDAKVKTKKSASNSKGGLRGWAQTLRGHIFKANAKMVERIPSGKNWLMMVRQCLIEVMKQASEKAISNTAQKKKLKNEEKVNYIENRKAKDPQQVKLSYPPWWLAFILHGKGQENKLLRWQGLFNSPQERVGVPHYAKSKEVRKAEEKTMAENIGTDFEDFTIHSSDVATPARKRNYDEALGASEERDSVSSFSNSTGKMSAGKSVGPTVTHVFPTEFLKFTSFFQQQTAEGDEQALTQDLIEKLEKKKQRLGIKLEKCDDLKQAENLVKEIAACDEEIEELHERVLKLMRARLGK